MQSLPKCEGDFWDGRIDSFIQLLQERARELSPDYPFSQTADAFDYLWAITSTQEGTEMARKEWENACRYLLSILQDTHAYMKELAETGYCHGRWSEVQENIFNALRKYHPL